MVAFAAMKTRYPVKWIEDRSENLAATIHGRDQIQSIEVAASKEGRVTGLKVHVIADLGSYLQFFTDIIAPRLTLPMVSGCYDIATISTRYESIFTNKAPTDVYRGAGRPEATFMIERAMDLVARELGKDPAEVRRINFVKPEQFPHKMATGAVYDSGNYEGALNKALQIADYQKLRAEQTQKQAEGKLMGIGLSCYVEISGFGPRGRSAYGLYESARVRVEQTGSVIISTGSSPHGQGTETTFAQLAASEFGIPLERVVVLHGATALTPEGRGTFGSRTTAVGGALSSSRFRSSKRR